MVAEIAHVVVLMLENRSLDSVLGRLYPNRRDFDGVTGNETNRWSGSDNPVKTWSSDTFTPSVACIPTPDPGELFSDIRQQIYGVAGQNAPPTMAGFVQNYMDQERPVGPRDPQAVMHGFTPEQLPVISTLAQAFGVCDRWHASAPNQTWPNRFFVHSGTAGGYVNNSPPHFPYTWPTIYERLTEAKRSWRVYFHDMPQVANLSQIWSELPEHLRFFDTDFAADAAAGQLPNYSFIEPRYFSDPVLGHMPNDQHPPHNVGYGERLIANVYNDLRQGPGWNRTLFIITYDEHGGLYDHVPPPATVAPDERTPDGVVFNRYGVRVPAVIVSPWIPPGSIIRPPPDAIYPFDHSSVLTTLRALFDLRQPLTQRDAVAPDLLHALSLPGPTNVGPENVASPTPAASQGELQTAHAAPLNHLQQALVELASHLPKGIADIPEHTGVLLNAAPAPIVPMLATVEQGLAHVRASLARFLGFSTASN